MVKFKVNKVVRFGDQLTITVDVDGKVKKIGLSAEFDYVAADTGEPAWLPRIQKHLERIFEPMSPEEKYVELYNKLIDSEKIKKPSMLVIKGKTK